MIYIVTYDLSQPGQNYDKLLNLIKEEINWARLGGSSYLVESNSTSVELRDKYKMTNYMLVPFHALRHGLECLTM